MHIRKAVFPVAGLGTRFLPATKVIPKEMLPIVDKPIIQYATEEAIRAGITELIFVTSDFKKSIREHYSPSPGLEQELLRRNKQDLFELIKGIVPAQISCFYVDQPQALGLGHAVLCAKELVAGEPFAVILPDDMIDDGADGCLSQMLEVYRENPASIIAVEHIDPMQTDRYGIVSTTAISTTLNRINAIVEKPKPELAPSSLAVVGRYLLSNSIFNHLETLGKGAGGEIQLTDAIAKLLGDEPVIAYEFSGERFDCGSRAGFVRATLNYARHYPDIADILPGRPA